jgi:hypothetical protein
MPTLNGRTPQSVTSALQEFGVLREKAPTEPRVHRQLKMDVQEEELVQHAARKIDLAGEVEEAAEYRYQNGIPAYACSTELPVEVLGAKYKWARGAGLI